jgi:Polysaccharide lyase
MNLANQTAARRLLALLTIPVCVLAVTVLALAGADPADARVRVVANVSPNAPAVQVTARTSQTAKRVFFLVDGRRQDVRHSVDWRHGRKGVLDVEGLRPGQHRLTAVAIHPGGRKSRGVRLIRLGRKRDGQRRRVGIKPASRLAARKSSAKTAEAPSRSLPPGVLFNGGFDDEFDGWHVQALSHRVSLFSDGAFHGGAARFEVHDGDVEPETDSERAEVSGPTFTEGQDLFVRNSIRVPSSSDSDTEWQLIQQLREHNWGGSPGMAVFLEDDRDLNIGAGDSSPMYWEGPELQADRWYDLVFRVHLAQSWDDGFVEVWLDGVPQEMLNGETRIYGQTIQRPSNYLKSGIYRSESSTGTTVVDHDNIIVGTTYDAVMAAS